MQYHQPIKTYQSLLFLVLATLFINNCSPRSVNVLTNHSNSIQGWEGVKHAEPKQKFKAFVGGWENMTYDHFLDKVAESVKKQVNRRNPTKNDGKIAYYIPMKYIPSTEEELTSEKKEGPFYAVAFQEVYPKVAGKLKNIYDRFLLPEEPSRSKDANLFIVACFLKLTEEVDRTLRQTDIDNDALIQQLTKLLQGFQDKVAEVYTKSDLYKNKNKYTEAMGIVAKLVDDENDRPKLIFEKNQQPVYAMNVRCMLTKTLANFIYKQCKEIKTEIDRLNRNLQEAAKTEGLEESA